MKTLKPNTTWVHLEFLKYTRIYEIYKSGKTHQKIVMPFFEPIVYPSQRYKYDIEQTVYITNILWSCNNEIRLNIFL